MKNNKINKKIFFINKMYDKNLFEIVYEDHKEIYDLDTLNCYLIYMSFNELISKLDLIDLNDNNEMINKLDPIDLNDNNIIIKINRDKSLFSKDWILKYETFKANNMCLILYKQEPDYIKVAEIEFISVELSDIEFLFNELNKCKNEIAISKKENEQLKNKIFELENLNNQSLLSKEILSYFEYKKNLIKSDINNFNIMIQSNTIFIARNYQLLPEYPNKFVNYIKILYEDNIYIYSTIDIFNYNEKIYIFPELYFGDYANIIYKELYVYNFYEQSNMVANLIKFNYESHNKKILYKDLYKNLYDNVEIIHLGTNKNYNIGIEYPKNGFDPRPGYGYDITISLWFQSLEQNFNNTIQNLNNFKNLKKIIIYDNEFVFGNKHYFLPINKNIIKILKENFEQKVEINSWRKN